MRQNTGVGTMIFGALCVIVGVITPLAASAAEPVVNTTITVDKTGSEPFDATTWDSAAATNAGTDESTSNNVVRLQDSITYKVEVSVNDAAVTDLMAEVLLDPKQSWIEVPTGCFTDPDAGLAALSAVVDSTSRAPGGDQRLLICNLGPAGEGTTKLVYPTARAIGASFDGTQITINDDHVSASVTAFSFGAANTATDGPTDTIVTADFKLNLIKELKVTAVDPDSGDSLYSPPLADGPNGETGMLMEYVIKASYGRGSMIADSDETSFEVAYNITDYFSDNNTQNTTAGGLSSGGVLYTWGPDQPGCALVGDHGANATVACAENVVVGDFTGATFVPDGLADPTVDIDLTAIDVRDPDGDGNLFEIAVVLWFDAETEVRSHQECPDNCVNFVVNGAGKFANGVMGGFNPVSTEDATGTNLANYGGAGEPFPDDTYASYPLRVSSPGSWSTIKSFRGVPWGADTKSAEQKVSPGQIIPVMLNVFDYRKFDGAVSQICEKIDTNSFEYVGLSAPFRTDMSYGFNDRRDDNPSIETWGGAAPMVYSEGGSTSTYLYSPAPFADLAEQRSGTCGDDVNEDGTINIVAADGTESSPGSPVDWYSDPDAVPGGRAGITRFRWETYYDKAAAAARYPGHNYYANALNIELKVKNDATGYGSNKFLPNWMVSRKNTGPGSEFSTWGGTTQGDLDPENVAFSYGGQFADRSVLVPSAHSIAKQTLPKGIKVVRGGDNVEFLLTPTVTGQWNDAAQNTATVRDYLPIGTDYVGGSERFSFDGGTTWLTYQDVAGGTHPVGITNLAGTGHPNGARPLVYEFDSVENGDQLPLIKYSVHIGDTLSRGRFTNTATIDSPMGVDVDEDGEPDPISVAYQLSIEPRFGLDVVKTVAQRVDDTNTPITFDLIYRNLGGENYTQGDFIDILPVNGDGEGTTGGLASPRTPGSRFHGSLAVTGLTGTNGEEFFATSASPTAISNDPCDSSNLAAGEVPAEGDLCFNSYTRNGNQTSDGLAAGSGATTWEACTATTDPVTCGAIAPADITAIRFQATPILGADGGHVVQLELTPSANVGGVADIGPDGTVTELSTGDLYTNSFGGRIPEISLQVISNDVTVTVVAGQIGDTIWFDNNSDATQGADEDGIPGINVALLVDDPDNPGTYIPYQIPDPNDPEATIDYVVATDAAGQYLFENLPSGKFKVAIDPATLPGGLVATADPDTLGDHSSELELFGPGYPDTANGLTSDDYNAVDSNLDQDFGYNGPGSIGDTIWLDLNGDGVQDAGEAGLAGVTVNVTYFGADGVAGGGDDVVYTTTTDADGKYLVENLPLGNFSTSVDPATLPPGLAQTYDADGSGDNASATELTDAAPQDLDQDFGYNNVGSIGDTIWKDSNGDGVQDAGEAGLAGVTVNVTYFGADGVAGGGDDVVYTTTTDADGKYLVENLPLGTYQVQVDSSTLPPGLGQTFDFDGGADGSSITALTVNKPADLDQDFGYNDTGTIAKTVWLDSDGDGVQDPGEEGIAGVTVSITYLGPDGVPGGGDDVVSTTVTDANGNYIFDQLPLGNYEVRVDPSSLPEGLQQTFDADGNNDNVSATTLTAAGPSDLDENFGYQRPAAEVPVVPEEIAFTGASTMVLVYVGFATIALGLFLSRRRELAVVPVSHPKR